MRLIKSLENDLFLQVWRKKKKNCCIQIPSLHLSYYQQKEREREWLIVALLTKSDYNRSYLMMIQLKKNSLNGSIL